jgi:hypothetical protein
MGAELGWSRGRHERGLLARPRHVGGGGRAGRALARPARTAPADDRRLARRRLLLLAWSRVTSLLAFYLIWIGLGVTLAAVLYEPAFWLVATWFRRGRGRALTLLTFIGGFAS